MAGPPSPTSDNTPISDTLLTRYSPAGRAVLPTTKSNGMFALIGPSICALANPVASRTTASKGNKFCFFITPPHLRCVLHRGRSPLLFVLRLETAGDVDRLL